MPGFCGLSVRCMYYATRLSVLLTTRDADLLLCLCLCRCCAACRILYYIYPRRNSVLKVAVLRSALPTCIKVELPTELCIYIKHPGSPARAPFFCAAATLRMPPFSLAPRGCAPRRRADRRMRVCHANEVWRGAQIPRMRAWWCRGARAALSGVFFFRFHTLFCIASGAVCAAWHTAATPASESEPVLQPPAKSQSRRRAFHLYLCLSILCSIDSEYP